MKRLNIKGSDIRDKDESDDMEMDMFDGEKDGENHRESMKKLDEKVRMKMGLMSPVVSVIKTEEDSDDIENHQDKKKGIQETTYEGCVRHAEQITRFAITSTSGKRETAKL